MGTTNETKQKNKQAKNPRAHFQKNQHNILWQKYFFLYLVYALANL